MPETVVKLEIEEDEKLLELLTAESDADEIVIPEFADIPIPNPVRHGGAGRKTKPLAIAVLRKLMAIEVNVCFDVPEGISWEYVSTLITRVQKATGKKFSMRLRDPDRNWSPPHKSTDRPAAPSKRRADTRVRRVWRIA
jgi:hypothetical protein